MPRTTRNIKAEIVEALLVCEGGMGIAVLADEMNITRSSCDVHVDVLVRQGDLLKVPVCTFRLRDIFGQHSSFYVIHKKHMKKHIKYFQIAADKEEELANPELRAISQVTKIPIRDIVGTARRHDISMTRHIARLLMFENGRTKREIADIMGNSKGTVRESVNKIVKKYLDDNYMGAADKLRDARKILSAQSSEEISA